MQEAEDIALRYIWLAEIGFYVLAVAIVLGLWGRVRKKAAARSDTTGAFISALGAPIILGVAGIGAQRVIQTAADNISHIAFETDSFRPFIVIICFFWALMRLTAVAEKIYSRPLKISGANIDRGAVQATFRVARYIIIIVAGLTAMESLGFSISGLLAFGGIGGAIVAFAAQKTLSNFFSGMIIFTERPFSVGDWIRCPNTDVEGVVENIGWRTTRLRTFDHRPLYVPNALFSDSVIENPQRMTNRRIYETMGLRYDDISKMAAVLEEIREMLRAHPDIDQNQIQMVNFDSYGASSLNFFIYAMTRTIKWKEFHQIKEDILLQVAAIVSRHKAEFAFPTRTLHLLPPDAAPPANPAEKPQQ